MNKKSCCLHCSTRSFTFFTSQVSKQIEDPSKAMFVEDGTGHIANQGSCKWKRIYDVNFKLDIVSMYLLEGEC